MTAPGMDPRLRRTFVVGGVRSHVFGTIADVLMEYGLGVVAHHEMERSSGPTTLPSDTEAVVVFNDMLPHQDYATAAIRAARERGALVIRTTRKRPQIIAACERAGLTPLPPRAVEPEAPEPVRVEPPPSPRGFIAFPALRVNQPLALPLNQWADTVEDARVLAQVVYGDGADLSVMDHRGRLVSLPVAAIPTSSHSEPGAAVSKTVPIPITPKILAALERRNAVRDFAGQAPLSESDFVAELLDRQLVLEDDRFGRMKAALGGK